MIELVAGHGLAAVDMRIICERAEVGNAHFNRCFADLEDCFLALHGEVIEDLCAQVAAACAGREAWHDRVWAAGMAAMRYLQVDSDRARFLFVAIDGVSPGARARRDEVVQRIADVLDGGRGEVEGERTMSRCTAEIAAGAVYGTIQAKIESGSIERGEEFLPELIYLATMPYLGQRAAEDELAVQPLR
jgi:AcrR family transcriptional regulator